MTQEARNRIWDSMLNVGRQSRYYQIFADKYQKRYLFLSMVTVVGSLAAATLLLLQSNNAMAQFASAVLFFAVATASASLVVFDYSRRSQIARTASERLKDLDVDLKILWHSGKDDADIRPEIERLEKVIEEVTRDDIPIDDKLNEQCNQEASDVLRSFNYLP